MYCKTRRLEVILHYILWGYLEGDFDKIQDLLCHHYLAYAEINGTECYINNLFYKKGLDCGFVNSLSINRTDNNMYNVKVMITRYYCNGSYSKANVISDISITFENNKICDIKHICRENIIKNGLKKATLGGHHMFTPLCEFISDIYIDNDVLRHKHMLEKMYLDDNIDKYIDIKNLWITYGNNRYNMIISYDVYEDNEEEILMGSSIDNMSLLTNLYQIESIEYNPLCRYSDNLDDNKKSPLLAKEDDEMPPLGEEEDEELPPLIEDDEMPPLGEEEDEELPPLMEVDELPPLMELNWDASARA